MTENTEKDKKREIRKKELKQEFKHILEEINKNEEEATPRSPENMFKEALRLVDWLGRKWRIEDYQEKIGIKY
ncbi:hypothetical protein KAS79_00865 [Candidatus Parcubacteria bacterium]|nr:hypothetical protein [Candidatus Parcubacteria bacterium]